MIRAVVLLAVLASAVIWLRAMRLWPIRVRPSNPINVGTFDERDPYSGNVTWA
jgi:hypothetical protein